MVTEAKPTIKKIVRSKQPIPLYPIHANNPELTPVYLTPEQSQNLALLLEFSNYLKPDAPIETGDIFKNISTHIALSQKSRLLKNLSKKGFGTKVAEAGINIQKWAMERPTKKTQVVFKAAGLAIILACANYTYISFENTKASIDETPLFTSYVANNAMTINTDLIDTKQLIPGVKVTKFSVIPPSINIDITPGNTDKAFTPVITDWKARMNFSMELLKAHAEKTATLAGITTLSALATLTAFAKLNPLKSMKTNKLTQFSKFGRSLELLGTGFNPSKLPK